MPDPLYLDSVEPLCRSVDLAIRGYEKIHDLDRKTRTEFLLGTTDKAQSLESEAVTRQLVEAWLLMAECLLVLAESLGISEGDRRIATLRSHQREFLAEQ